MLLARGAKQELQVGTDLTALHWAAIASNRSILELLCAAPGAAVARSLRDKDGRTPLALAIHHRFAASEAVLRAHGATE